MKLKFDDVAESGKDLQISAFCWKDPENEAVSAIVDANLHALRVGGGSILLSGHIDGKRTGLCDRCGEEGEFSLSGDFVYRITTAQVDFSGHADVECTEEDAQALYLDEPEIDIDEILREQILLAVPMQTLCREDCLGICAGCGAGLNHEPCSCSSDNSNSPFAILGKLGK